VKDKKKIEKLVTVEIRIFILFCFESFEVIWGSSELLKWKISQKEKLTAQVAKRALF
jgi:hypothetical protein